MPRTTSIELSHNEKWRAFVCDAQRSLAEFKRTGVAYTHDDVISYFLAKAAGKNPRRPKPIKVPRAKRW